MGRFVQEAAVCSLKLILLCSFLPSEGSFSKGRQPTGDSEFALHRTRAGPPWGKAALLPRQPRRGSGHAATLLRPAGRGRPPQLQAPELKFSLTPRQTGKQAETRTNLGYTHTHARTPTLGT